VLQAAFLWLRFGIEFFGAKISAQKLPLNVDEIDTRMNVNVLATPVLIWTFAE